MITRIEIAEFLRKNISEFGIVKIDLWHIIHFISGAWMMVFLILFFKESKKENNYPFFFIMLFIFLFFYEAVEIAFILMGSGLFMVETKLNIFLDIIFGMVGGIIVYYGFK